MVKRRYRVKEMHCSNCAMIIEAIEDELPGIRLISASYQKGTMVVEFDDLKVSEAQIIAAVDRRGYQAMPFTDE
jgi:copper chaperone CopZ